MSINNKRSYTEYTVTQPTTDFPVGFNDYSDSENKDNVLVTLDGIDVITLGYTVQRKSDLVIKVTPAITTGTVRLQRETNIDLPFHQFTAGALFSAGTMDDNFAQVLRSQQEVRDGFVFLQGNANSVFLAAKATLAEVKVALLDVAEFISKGASIESLTVTILPTTDTPKVITGGTPNKRTFELQLPRGVKGEVGADATIDFLPVETGAAGTPVVSVVSGTPSARTIALTIPKGDKGADGKSAYQSALDNGFIGTEAEWKLYLKSDGSIQALQQFMTNPAATDVTVPDYGNIPSLQGYISTMFENGGLPATPFRTKAIMEASSLADDAFAMVTDNTAFNGLYFKSGGIWNKSAYDPVNMAVSTIEKLATVKAKRLTTEGLDSLTESGRYYQVGGSNATAARGYPELDSGFLDLKVLLNGSGTAWAVGSRVYTTGTSGNTYVSNYDAIGLKWNPWVKQSSVKDIADVKTELSAPKIYENIFTPTGKNLFNENNIQDGKYLNTSGILRGAAGWGASEYIPVVAGTTYTISGNFGYSWVAFFTNNTATYPLSHAQPASYPYTVVAPVNAKFMIINLYSASSTSYSDVQVEVGAVATAYESGTPLMTIKKGSIFPPIEEGGGGTNTAGAKATLVGDNLTVKAKTVEQTARVKRAFSLTESQVFNFTEAKLNDVVISVMGDDVAPLFIADAQIGANHSYMGGRVTLVGHGKTVADIGSLWNDALTRECILLDVVDANTLLFTQTASNTSFGTSNLVFTHKSGAVNTTTINATSVSSVQVYPAINKHTISLSSDGIVLDYTDQELVFKDNFTVSESYGVLAKADVIPYLKANAGKKTTSYDTVLPVAHMNNSYTFDSDGGCTITSSVTALKSVSFGNFMMLQSVKIQGGGLTYFIPKTVPFNQNSITYDFTKGVDIAATQKPTSIIDFDSSRVDATKKPVDRYIQRSSVGGFALGLLPVLDGEPTRRSELTTTKVGRISTALKIYHSLVDATAITSMAVGDTFIGKGYRKYFGNPDSDKISKYAVYDTEGDYYFVDYKSGVARVDIMDLPPKLQNRGFTVHEKSSNVTVVSKATTSQLIVKITASAESSYLVLKF